MTTFVISPTRSHEAKPKFLVRLISLWTAFIFIYFQAPYILFEELKECGLEGNK